MNINLESLIIESLQHGVPISSVEYNKDTNSLEFELNGFSKSGTGILTINEKDEVILKTRYNEIDVIESFEDICNVARRWANYRPDYYQLPKWFNNEP